MQTDTLDHIARKVLVAGADGSRAPRRSDSGSFLAWFHKSRYASRRVAEPCGPDRKSLDAYAHEWTDERSLQVDVDRAVAQARLPPGIHECLLVAYRSVDAAVIDCGDGDHYDSVMNFCAPRIRYRVFAGKGVFGSRPGFALAKGKKVGGRLAITASTF